MVGRWSIDRELLDRATGGSGSFLGVLDVTPVGERYEWSESGELRWAGRTIPAYRVLAIAPRPDGWWMTFANGLPFHPWVVDEDVVHPCRNATYRGRITALALGPRAAPTVAALQITWDVTGPEKDQLIVTRLQRRPQCQ